MTHAPDSILCNSPGISCSQLFFFNDTATTEIYTLSLHDALPIYQRFGGVGEKRHGPLLRRIFDSPRSEEHTSELQSRQYLVCRLLLEKNMKKRVIDTIIISMSAMAHLNRQQSKESTAVPNEWKFQTRDNPVYSIFFFDDHSRKVIHPLPPSESLRS